MFLILSIVLFVGGLLIVFAGFYFNSSECQLEQLEDRIFRDEHMLQSKVKAKSLSRKNRALRLMTNQVCSDMDCFANSNVNEEDIQRKLDEIVANLLINGHFGVCLFYMLDF